MKIDKLRQRLQRSRPMTTISLRMPEDVIEDLKAVAGVRGFSGYQPLIRAYVGQGLRVDLEALEKASALDSLLTSLRRLGVAPEILEQAMAEAQAA